MRKISLSKTVLGTPTWLLVSPTFLSRWSHVSRFYFFG